MSEPRPQTAGSDVDPKRERERERKKFWLKPFWLKATSGSRCHPPSAGHQNRGASRRYSLETGDPLRKLGAADAVSARPCRHSS